MARLTVDGSDLVLLPRPWERLVTGVGPVRLPLGAVDGVAVQTAVWRCLRGERERGVAVPDALWLGTWRHLFGRDLVAVRPRGGPCVQVDFRPTARFARVSVTVREPEAVVERLRAALAERAATPQR